MNQETCFTGVRFHPWVGEHYRNSMFGVRLLVLGESHYGETIDENSDITSIVVRLWGQEHRSRFFTKIAQVLLRRTDTLTDRTRADVWEHVAFYNYVQTFVGPGPRIPPTPAEWAAADVPFRVVLGELQPNAVLVLGRRLWYHICFKLPGVAFAHILHPSSSHMSVADSIPVLEGLLRRA